MTIKVRMTPHLDDLGKGVSGIHTLIAKYFQHASKHGIELVGKDEDSFDLFAVHAGTAGKYPEGVPTVSSLHGLYWSAEYRSLSWEISANREVIYSIRKADQITVPSEWVADVIRRECRVNPHIIPHGIDWKEWQHKHQHDGYVLAYAKNRVMDVCNPAFISELAHRFPETLFICTFAPKDAPANVRVTGLLPHDKMKEVIQRAAVVLSPIRETFGILTLEALASGTPVLGYANGGNNDLIKHGVSGYLAQQENIEDLAAGLRYCLEHRDTLGKNANQLAKQYTWDAAMEKLVKVYQQALQPKNGKVSVVIPAYNYSAVVGRAIKSVLEQTRMVHEIIVVDDGSPDDGATERAVSTFAESIVPVKYIRQNNAGVAVARNTGVANAEGEFIICLDSDDQLDPQFVAACLPALQEDNTIGIAYTGLLTVKPDGSTSVSQWPPEYNFDDMVYPGGINQVPTACMFRKEMWRRLGGYRSRYCPNGAGSEDAEFWLRAGLYGYGGKKVTDAPLFIYSYQTGQVSGNKAYREIDWRYLHPSTLDQQHPFMCVATPLNGKASHPVRHYDDPQISVIVPVGPGHKQHVVNALDSLESQTMRKWEVILIDDTGDNDDWVYDGVPDILRSYPYVRLIKTSGKKGSGYARNRGVELAKAPMLLFLDADDNLFSPDALQRMMDGWNELGVGIYPDYISKAVISPEEAAKLKQQNRLLDYNEQTGLAMHNSYAAEYECERAVRQPDNPLYIWNLVTTLIPKAWHDEIGGFDESMPSWEDWEYWLRMARAGKCFARLPEPCVVYRFYTGGRRETGIEMPQQLLGYIIDKLKGVIPMPCSSCGSKKRVSVPITVNKARVETQPSSVTRTEMTDSDLVLIMYNSPNRGMHKVVGANTKTNYGYRAGGGVERFYIHKDDISARPDLFIPVREERPVVQSVQQPLQPPAPMVEEKPSIEPPQEISVPDFLQTKPADTSNGPGQNFDTVFKPVDWQSIPGVTEKISNALINSGVRAADDVIALGVDGLMKIDGVGKKRAESILSAASRMKNK